MSVTEQPVEPMSEVLGTDAPALDAQAALELAHELVLVTRATFAQLLPETATRAVSGVPGLGGAAVPEASPSSAPVLTQASTVTTLPIAVSPAPTAAPPTTVTAATASVSVPAIAVATLAASGDPTSEVEEIAVVSEEPERSDVVISPTISLSIPAPTATIDKPADYVPVPGVETPVVATNVPLVPAAPIAAPVQLAIAEPAAEAAQESETTEQESTVPEVPEPVAPFRPFHPNLAMLEEISFLDE